MDEDALPAEDDEDEEADAEASVPVASPVSVPTADTSVPEPSSDASVPSADAAVPSVPFAAVFASAPELSAEEELVAEVPDADASVEAEVPADKPALTGCPSTDVTDPFPAGS